MHYPQGTLKYMALRPSVSILFGMCFLFTSAPGIIIFIIKPYDISAPTGLSSRPIWLFVIFLLAFSIFLVVGVSMIFWGLRNAACPGSALYRLTRLRLAR